MIIGRQYLAVIIMFSTLAANANLWCSDLFQNKFTERAAVTTFSDSSLRPTEITIVKEKFEDNDQTLLDIIDMHTRTPDIELGIRDNRLKLGVILENGYSLEITYKADDRENRRFTLEEGKMISPSNRSKTLTHNFLEFKALNLKSENKFDLSDIYEDGKQITIRLPEVIEGKVHARLIKLLEAHQMKKMDKMTVRQMIANYSMWRFENIMWQRSIENFIKERVKRYSITAVLGTALWISATGDHNGLLKQFSTDQRAWVEESMTRATAVVPDNLKTQMGDLHTLTTLAIQNKAEMPDLKRSMEAKKMVLSATNHAWITVTTDKVTKLSKTYFVISQEEKGGNITLFSVELDAKAFADVISYFKKSDKVLNIN